MKECKDLEVSRRQKGKRTEPGIARIFTRLEGERPGISSGAKDQPMGETQETPPPQSVRVSV